MPLMLLVGVTTKGTPLQVTVLIAVTSGVGFSVTTSVKAAPTQLPEVGATLYVTVWVLFVLFNKDPVTIVGLFVADAPPVTLPVKLGTNQL